MAKTPDITKALQERLNGGAKGDRGRHERLAAELRANLKRRKAKERGGTEPPAATNSDFSVDSAGDRRNDC